MVRKHNYASRRALSRGVFTRIRDRAELEALVARDPGPWTIIKTADLEDLIDGADVAASWPELAEAMREGLR